ncbi:Retrovirus-related Pol polyprotein from transposon TNT 1-94 [Araneus ventricosus]|uniref:Retrovirus-related Pol polyprotein from transposon TNT 1-94 n=1 Tax=Araneus ventricosus TaxID=182803 RepID=A0A4Y2JVK4_ARAVE|nr:Retrovirus-related Pol polyprotein from transposon TNT 1-94 [Araneus ventricosus]
MLISIAASENPQFLQFDVKTAFLYEELQEEVFMKQPEGYYDKSSRVCRLKKSLYGLKQVLRFWNRSFVDFIHNQGLKASVSDPCPFIRINKTSKLLVVIYVDDGLVSGNIKEEMSEFVNKLSSKLNS